MYIRCQFKKSTGTNGPSSDTLDTSSYCTQYLGTRTTSILINTEQACHPSDRIDSILPNGAFTTMNSAAGAFEMDMNLTKETLTTSDGRITPSLRCPADQSHRDRDMPPKKIQKINTYSRPITGVVTRSQRAALRKAEREATGLRVAPDGIKEEHGGHRIDDTLGAVGGNKSVDEVDDKDCGSAGEVIRLKALRNEDRDGVPSTKHRDCKNMNEYDGCWRSEREKRSEEYRKKNQPNSAEDTLILGNTRCLYDLRTKGRGEVSGCVDVSKSYKKESLKAVSEPRTNRLGPVTRSMRRV